MRSGFGAPKAPQLRAAKSAQDYPKRPKDAPRAEKSATRVAQECPKSTQEQAKSTQERPKSAQERPKKGKERPKCAQRAALKYPKSAPRVAERVARSTHKAHCKAIEKGLGPPLPQPTAAEIDCARCFPFTAGSGFGPQTVHTK